MACYFILSSCLLTFVTPVDLSKLSRHKFTVHRLIGKQIRRRLSTSQPPSRPSSSDQTVHARRLVTLQRTTAASSASEISCQLPRPRFKNSRPTHGQGRSPEIESDRQSQAPWTWRRRSGSSRRRSRGSARSSPMAPTRYPLGPLSVWRSLSGTSADLSHPRRRIFLLLCCHLRRGLGWDSSPPLSMLRALCSLMCMDQ